ncbi:MAG: formylglycine-generating enzyme family protein, partial [Pseudomonadota bacterium]
AEFPVTQELWEAVMGENPSHFKGATLPVEEVSWDDTQRFLEKLNALTGEKYRLPSEAEWEFAARGGRLSQGFKYAGSNDLEAVAWYDKNSNQKTHPVGELLPNELGLHDMSGNVYEWCQDHWHENYEGAPLDGSAWTTKTGVTRVYRGGGWLDHPRYCRVAFRRSAEPDIRCNFIGFRLARSS